MFVASVSGVPARPFTFVGVYVNEATATANYVCSSECGNARKKDSTNVFVLNGCEFPSDRFMLPYLDLCMFICLYVCVKKRQIVCVEAR